MKEETFKNEKEVVNFLIHLLNSKGHFVWRNNSGVVKSSYKGKQRLWRAGLKGSADILGIAKDGKFIAIECKFKTNKPTPSQVQFLEDIRTRGGYAFLARGPEDLSEKLTN